MTVLELPTTTAARCGVCDSTGAALVCATCHEPVCEGHALYVRDAAGVPIPMCVHCFQEGRGFDSAVLARQLRHRDLPPSTIREDSR